MNIEVAASELRRAVPHSDISRLNRQQLRNAAVTALKLRGDQNALDFAQLVFEGNPNYQVIVVHD